MESHNYYHVDVVCLVWYVSLRGCDAQMNSTTKVDGRWLLVFEAG